MQCCTAEMWRKREVDDDFQRCNETLRSLKLKMGVTYRYLVLKSNNTPEDLGKIAKKTQRNISFNISTVQKHIEIRLAGNEITVPSDRL